MKQILIASTGKLMNIATQHMQELTVTELVTYVVSGIHKIEHQCTHNLCDSDILCYIEGHILINFSTSGS